MHDATMMVTGGGPGGVELVPAQRRSPFKRAAGEENFGQKCRSKENLSDFLVVEPWSPSPLSWEVDPLVWPCGNA